LFEDDKFSVSAGFKLLKLKQLNKAFFALQTMMNSTVKVNFISLFKTIEEFA